MSLGSSVRALFGQHERKIAAVYRSAFIDLDDFVALIRKWVPAPTRILEVGAGEGAVTERLAHAYPNAHILAIDVMGRVGRLYEGPLDFVTFRQTTVQEVAEAQPGEFDLVMLSDVIHHVPPPIREEIVAALRACLAPGGKLLLKDWARTNTPIHFACWASDRFVTGDRVKYLVPAEAEAMISRHFGGSSISARAKVAPWRNNFALLVDG